MTGKQERIRIKVTERQERIRVKETGERERIRVKEAGTYGNIQENISRFILYLRPYLQWGCI